MNKLFVADLSRAIKNKTLWLCFAIMFLIGLVLALKIPAETPSDVAMFACAFFVGIPCAVFCSLFTGTQYSEGTLRNKLVVGHKRHNIYLALLSVNGVTSFVIASGYMLAVLLVGIFRLAPFQNAFFDLAFYLLAIFLIINLYAVIYTTLCMLISGKATSSVICCLLSFALLILGNHISVRVDDSIGVTKGIYLFLFNILPSCQGLQLIGLSGTIPRHLIGYSLAVSVVIAVIGAICFRRKELK